MANIFSQFMQPVRSVTDRMADFDAQDFRREQLTGARNQNALQSLAMRKSIEADATAREDQNILRGLAAQTGGDQNALIKAARASGRLGLSAYADSLEKSLLDRQTKEAEIRDKEAGTLKTHLGALKTLAGGVMANPSLESAAFAIDAFERFTGRKMPEERAKIAQLKTPEDIRRWAASHALEADKLLPTIQNRDIGGSAQTLAIDPLTGIPTVTGSVDKTATPDAVMTDKRTREEGAANRGVQIRGQNLTDARQREKNSIDKDAVGKVEWKQDTNGNWIALPKEVSGSGPVTPIATTAPGKRETQAKQALNIIDQAASLIDKGTASYLGAAVDQGARVFGGSTAGADAAAQLQALEGALMMAQPRMEGPQSDKDVALYRQMAAQIGDSTVPKSQKRAAINEIRRLHELYAGGGQGAPQPTREAAKPAGKAPSVSNW